MSTEKIEGEDVTVIRTKPLAPVEQPSADLVSAGQTDRGIALFEERARNSIRMTRAALQITKPSQWMVYGEGDKRSIYATAGAADRILRQGFGMRWGPKTVTVEVTQDEAAIVATCEADLLNPDGVVYERFFGTRRGEFRGDTIKGYLKDEQALMKGAIANMKHRAVTAVLGLSFLTPEDFAELGLPLDRLKRRVEFQDRQADPSEQRVPFGRLKGKLPSELDQSELDWHQGAAEKAIADPAKAKWQRQNQAWLDAIMAEQARRSATTEAPATEQPKTGPDDLPPWPGSEQDSPQS